jgi:hypothetical protein
MFNEIAFFFMFILSGLFYILMAFIFKLKKDSSFDVPEDPWSMKDALDFLEY